MYDVIVIGGGPGGYVAAIRSAQLGQKVAVIEKENLGGICLNWGCIPSKALLKSAQMFKQIQKAKAFGIEIKGEVTCHLPSIIKRSRDVSQKLKNGIQVLMKSNKIDVIKGEAKFLNDKEISVNNEVYKAKSFIIATGARARLLPGVSVSKRIWTYMEALNPPFEEAPKKMLIVGSGPIGMEFSTFYKAIGSEVTVIEVQNTILPFEDEDVSVFAKKQFEKDGIRFIIGQSVQTINENENAAEVTFSNGQKEVFDVVLIAIGVIGNTENLGLSNTKVKFNSNQIEVNEYNQTEVPNIYAIGDVTSHPRLAHKASHEGIFVSEFIKGLDVKPLNVNRIPLCTYSLPQIASVGLTEKKARELGIKLRVGRFDFKANGKALAMDEDNGFIKTIFDAKTGELLGVHMIGADVTELIHSMVLSMELEATEEDLIHAIFPHPTLSEMIHESVLNAYHRTIHSTN